MEGGRRGRWGREGGGWKGGRRKGEVWANEGGGKREREEGGKKGNGVEIGKKEIRGRGRREHIHYTKLHDKQDKLVCDITYFSY